MRIGRAEIIKSALLGYLNGGDYLELLAIWISLKDVPVLFVGPVKNIIEELGRLKQFEVIAKMVESQKVLPAIEAAMIVYVEHKLKDNTKELLNKLGVDFGRTVAPIALKYAAQMGDEEWIGRIIGTHLPPSNDENKKVVAEAIKEYAAAGFEKESKKLKAVYEITEKLVSKGGVPEVDIPSVTYHCINEISDLEMRKILLVECLYRQKTYLGRRLWWDAGKDMPTAALKRVPLRSVVNDLVNMNVDLARLPGLEAFALTSYPSKKDLHIEDKLPPAIIPTTLVPRFTIDTKDAALDYIFAELDRTHPDKNDSARPATLFALIKKVSVNSYDLEISLLVDCIYKPTRLGTVCWPETKPTPTLKRGVLNAIVEYLKTKDVDLAKLPGFGTYAPSMFAMTTTYPSKTVIGKLFPPKNIPVLDVKSDFHVDEDTESDSEKGMDGSAVNLLNGSKSL